MRTCAEMIEFASQYMPNFADIMQLAVGPIYVKSFTSIEEALTEDENVSFTLPLTSWNKGNTSTHSMLMDCGALALTNKRLLISGRMCGLLAKGTYCDLHSIDSVLSVSILSQTFGVARIKIETKGEDDLQIFFPKNIAQKVVNDLSLAIEKCKNSNIEAGTTIVNMALSSADEIKKYKKLLDIGAITQEEFDAKKKQLLGL